MALQSHLRAVLEPSRSCALTAVDVWDTFADVVRAELSDVLVVDPCADGSSRAAEITVLLNAQPGTPVVIYGPPSPMTFQAIAEMARGSAPHAAYPVVLHHYDDEPRRFLGMLQRQPGTALSIALLDRLGPALGLLPTSLARAVERLLLDPSEFDDVGDLAHAAQITIRTAYRQLGGAGFSSPRALVVGARLLRVYAYARDPGQSLETLATQVGYRAPRVMTKHMRDVLGVSPRGVRRRLRPTEFVDALATWMCPAPRAGAPPAAGRPRPRADRQSAAAAAEHWTDASTWPAPRVPNLDAARQ
jgi:AraC-like DNA-binding protein